LLSTSFMVPNQVPNHDHKVIVWLLLGYMVDHPEAKDTLEGIQRWWLPPTQIESRPDTLQTALDYLVERGWLAIAQAPTSTKVYGLNKQRLEELKDMF